MQIIGYEVILMESYISLNLFLYGLMIPFQILKIFDLKYDSGYLDKFLLEIELAIKQSQEYQILSSQFKKAVSRFAKDSEDVLLLFQLKTQIIIQQKISRIFDKEEEGVILKDKIRQLMNLRLEDMRRQIDNQEEAQQYAEKIRENRLKTLSKFDIQIIKDTEEFVMQMCDPETFDGSMIFCAKTILSYYEVRKDRILSDYLYMLVIPLMSVFAEAKHLHKIPVDLVGYFFSIQKVVSYFDPLVDLLVIQDEYYEQEMTDFIMSSLALVDQEVLDKIQEVLNLDIPSQRTLIVLIVKRFVHSLGFAFLPMNKKAYKKKWLEGEEENKYQKNTQYDYNSKLKSQFDEDESEYNEESGLHGRKVELQKINAEDIMKQLKIKQQIPENMGIVPIINDDESENSNHNVLY
ncbi:hypothetical protein IMG5_098680 [Ichthyophthirius multifiliis]|uniref:Uncharacterized protein n=1 Tax=Ichthyophthirius multifiliis TaxID=5932 RepID=G0QS02_ICHMU|nr:hypothetical protein IMG5_098680 [Ichthyophthirius multifiliis]EGR32032.1 hypothetical protein IMG5_098680 [Ichthyophthirius multifiliis]|eukprot:XP_004035518.1 hypothetical protein IMG5_098680 [Ichthyophthirius multifiliis]